MFKRLREFIAGTKRVPCPVYRGVVVDIGGCSQRVLDTMCKSVLFSSSVVPNHTGMLYKHLQVLIVAERHRQHLGSEMFKSQYGIHIAAATTSLAIGDPISVTSHVVNLDGKYKVCISVVWDDKQLTEDQFIAAMGVQFKWALDVLCLIIEKE